MDRSESGVLTVGWMQDVRYAVRSLRRHPLSVAAAVLTLVLGVGASAAVYTVVDAVLLRPLPFHEPQRLLDIHEHPAGDPHTVMSVSIQPGMTELQRTR